MRQLEKISTFVKKAGHGVELRQMCEDLGPLQTKDEFITSLMDINPDIIGLSVVTNQWQYAKELAAWARETLDIPLVCCGIHATIAAEKSTSLCSEIQSLYGRDLGLFS